jgi:hypothetical protein
MQTYIAGSTVMLQCVAQHSKNQNWKGFDPNGLLSAFWLFVLYSTDLTFSQALAFLHMAMDEC